MYLVQIDNEGEGYNCCQMEVTEEELVFLQRVMRKMAPDATPSRNNYYGPCLSMIVVCRKHEASKPKIGVEE